MLSSKRVLVALDEQTTSHYALERARLIAERMGAELELLWTGRLPAWTGYAEALETLAQQGCRWQQQIISGSLTKAVCQRWQEGHFGLLVKGCDSRHDQPSLLAPRDWQLLRETPCPVLLVKNSERWYNGRILASINPLSLKETKDHHNQSILLMAAFVAQQSECELHTVVATPSPMLAAEPEMQVQSLIEAKTLVATEKLLMQMQLQSHGNHVGEGPPEHWIPQVVADVEASLVVIGTHARAGLKGILMGNTAEQILDKVDTDVMVLRTGIDESLIPHPS